MAASFSLLLPLLLLSVLLSSAAARPCKSLFLSYTITTTSTSADFTQLSASSSDSDLYPSRFFAVYRVITPHSFPRPQPHLALRRPAPVVVPATSSVQERAKDILVVVAGLLFGVGCGAITAATMYLAWSLLTNQYEICGSCDSEDEDESPKKMGYVKIADPVSASAKTKEGYEG